MTLIDKLLFELETKNIRYVHWKSNTNIEKALSGEDDLDILVFKEDKKKLLDVFYLNNIIAVNSYKDSYTSSISHHIGLDTGSNLLVHIHLHFELEIGYDQLKQFRIPLEQELINTGLQYKNIRIPKVEFEYILLVIRLSLKNSLAGFILKKPSKHLKPFLKANELEEYLDLSVRSDMNQVHVLLQKYFVFLDEEIFRACEKSIGLNSYPIKFLKNALRLELSLKEYSKLSLVQSCLLALLRNLHIYMKMLLLNKWNTITLKKTLKNGGRIFSFTGGDGAGKSTNIELLKSKLEVHFEVKSLHYGRPRTCLKSLPFLGLYFIFKGFGLTKQAASLNYLALGINRREIVKRALKLRREGFIVLLDRMWMKGITTMDCPKICSQSYRSRIWKKIGIFEKKLYQEIDVDEVFVLKLPPSIALIRRPEDDEQELLLRSGEIWNETWKCDFAKRVDCQRPLADVHGEILSLVWKNISEEVKIIELLGVAGVGKSTLANELKKKKGNLIINPTPSRTSMLLWKHIWKNRGLIFTIMLSKSQLKKEIIAAIVFSDIYLDNKFVNSIRNKHKLIVFDQGILFLLAFLEKEYPEIKVQNFHKVKINRVITDYYDSIIYLSCPINVLIERINTRDNWHRIKGENEDNTLKFLREYETIYLRLINYLDHQNNSVLGILKTDLLAPDILAHNVLDRLK